jgi:hypothetical protein
MNSGVYIIEGGGFSVSGTGTVTGSGVVIFNVGSTYPTTGGTYGSINLAGSGSFNLTPPTSGTYAGILFFQPSDNTKTISVSGNSSGMTGAIYAPKAQLNLSASGQLNDAIDVDRMTVSGSGIELVQTHDVSPGPGGQTATTQNLGVAGSSAATSASAPSRSIAGVMALDLVLADAGTTANATTSWINPMAARHQVTQTDSKGSTLNVVVIATKPAAVDPGAVDALLSEGMSVRSTRIANRAGQPIKWSL